MTQPLVSIALPTKNRAFLLKDCIRLALDQSYQNIELVVADNDDTQATREVVETFKDPRLKYVKTGNLSMPDNWEHAFRSTTGEVVMMLEDKQFLKHHAAEAIVKRFEDPAVDVVTWGSNSFDDLGFFKRVWSPPPSRKSEVLTCDEVLEKFLRGSSSEWSHFLPIAHLSAVRRTLADKVGQSSTGRQFLPMNPDYTSAFQWLAHGEKVACLADPLVVYCTKQHSNGRAIQLKLPSSAAFFKDLKSKDSIGYDRIPVKVMTIPGSIFNDFIKLQELVGGRLARHAVDMPRLYIAIHASLSGALREGADVTDELRTWQTALEAEPPEIRKQVLARVKTTRRKSTWGRSLKNVENQVKGCWKSWILRRPEWRFANAADFIQSEKNRYLSTGPT